MSAAIYGAGSLGTILGAFITKNGGQIDLINRNKAHVAALQANGASVRGTLNFNQKVTAYTVDEMSGIYDIIFLMTKQQDNVAVVTKLKDFLAEDGVIVTLQNGIPELQIGEIVGEDRVLGCTVAWGATMQEPGVCELTSSPEHLTFSLGYLSENPNHHLAEVRRLLELMGPCELDENFINYKLSDEAEFLEKLEAQKKAILDKVNKAVNKSSKISSVEVMEEPFEKTATMKIRRFLYKKTNSPKADKEKEKQENK